jgi:hypothetical protein
MFNFNYEYYEDPFPHIIIKDFIQDKLVLDYLAENDELKQIMKPFRNLERWGTYVGVEGKTRWTEPLPSNKFSPTFNEYVSKAIEGLYESDEFFQMMDDVFRPVLEEEYEGFDDPMSRKMSMFSYGAYNEVTEAKNIIGWHIDGGDKLISGLYYLKEHGDVADDGHLQLTDGEGRPIKEVPYENNVLVLWANTPKSWHRATVRYPTTHLRRIINIALYSEGRKKYHDFAADKHDIHDATIRSVNELHSIKIFRFKEVNKL